MTDEKSKSEIQRLNDLLRCKGQGGRIMMTSGINMLGSQTVAQILAAVASFDAFNGDNDPHGEHDCAIQKIDGRKIIWKIDYYDPSLRYHSEDPADPSKTCRVLTVMLAHEY
tara:strand:- start:13690 stop:14025 length:336 start_codon:yes stop_codon:yes gene_type:complete